ncbi:TetR/AcrR family transcriptional regulator [Flindersiella endophytica]
MERPLRADAQRNRGQIIEAALTLFAEQGINAPMEEVARRAGVGVGTLYRRFPDRDALIYAVAVEAMRRLASLARTAWEASSDPWDALVRYVRGCAELRPGSLQTGLDPRLHDAIRQDPELAGERAELMDLLGRMVSGAQAAGVLRADVGPGDIMLLITQLTGLLPDLPGPMVDLLPSRYLELMLAGLRATDAPPLPGTPISGERLANRRG